MIEEGVTEQEVVFLEALRKYENKWVTIHKTDEVEVVVGSGSDAAAALADAKGKGFSDAVLFYVRPSDKGFLTHP
jgi:hypothetical protein